MVDIPIIGIHVGTSIAVGVVAGLTGWFLEDAVINSLQSKKWFIPLMSGLAGSGLYLLVAYKGNV